MFGCGLRLAGGSLMRPLLVFHWMMDESIVTKMMVEISGGGEDWEDQLNSACIAVNLSAKKRQSGINSERRRQYCL